MWTPSSLTKTSSTIERTITSGHSFVEAGATVAQAQAELHEIAKGSNSNFLKLMPAGMSAPSHLRMTRSGEHAQGVPVLMGAVRLRVADRLRERRQLCFVRAASRQREIAVRWLWARAVLASSTRRSLKSALLGL
jgi:hypothetical protein